MIEINARQSLGEFAQYLQAHAHDFMVWYDVVESSIEELLDDDGSFVVNYVLRELTGTWTIVLTVEDENIEGGGELSIICEENGQ